MADPNTACGRSARRVWHPPGSHEGYHTPARRQSESHDGRTGPVEGCPRAAVSSGSARPTGRHTAPQRPRSSATPPAMSRSLIPTEGMAGKQRQARPGADDNADDSPAPTAPFLTGSRYIARIEGFEQGCVLLEIVEVCALIITRDEGLQPGDRSFDRNEQHHASLGHHPANVACPRGAVRSGSCIAGFPSLPIWPPWGAGSHFGWTGNNRLAGAD